MIFDLRFVGVRELEAVPIGIRHHQELGLPADPARHVHVAIRRTPTADRIHASAHAGAALLAHPAAAARDVERNAHQVADLERFDVAADFDHEAGRLVAQRLPGDRVGPAADHVLIAAADVRGHELDDHAMVNRPAAELLGELKLRIADVDDLDFAPALVNDAFVVIVSHVSAPPTAILNRNLIEEKTSAVARNDNAPTLVSQTIAGE